MKLYYSPNACSLAPHIALHEAQASFVAVPVDLANKRFAGGDYRKVNPKGSVPALEVDGNEVLTEAAVILQFIADRYPQAKLMPDTGTWERYRAMEWLNYIATELHKGFGPLWKKDTPEDYKPMVKEMLATRFAYLSDALEGGHYLLGKTYSVADAYLFTVLNWTRLLHVDITPWPHLLGFMERMKGRPATLAAMKAEGTLK